MGLYVHLDVEEVGLPTTLEKTAVDRSTVSVEIDYSEALNSFVETFTDVATELVPVDTGYLQSTIYAETDEEYTADCYADAEYAQYPEYGTWCQEEQPYFRPAFEEAWVEFCTGAAEAVQNAEDELKEELNDIAMAEMDTESGYMGGMGAVVMAVLMFPLALYGYGIQQTISDAFTDNSGSIAEKYSEMGIKMPEVEIT